MTFDEFYDNDDQIEKSLNLINKNYKPIKPFFNHLVLFRLNAVIF
jgi:hypothetical protein